MLSPRWPCIGERVFACQRHANLVFHAPAVALQARIINLNVLPCICRYLELLRDGASYHNLRDSYQSWLATVPSIPSEYAEASPERISTPAKKALNIGLAAIGAAALLTAAYRFFGSG